MKTDDLCLYYVQRPPPTCEGVSRIQAYFPSLETLFPSIQTQTTGTPTLASMELVVDVSGSVATIENIVSKSVRQVPVWTRKIHLVEPVEVMSGNYILPADGSLPTFRNAWQTTLRKINDPYNEAYTAALASCMTSRLVETGVSPHFCRFYGTYSGRADEYRFNITEDLPDIEDEKWFRDGITTGAFQILAVDPYNPEIEGELEPWLPGPIQRVSEGSTLSSSSTDAEDDASSNSSASDDDGVVEAIDDDIPIDAEEAVLSRPRIRLGPTAAASYSSYSGSDESESDLDYLVALKNFPVQLTFLERCDGTMDKLMDDEVSDDATDDMKETKEARWTAWMFQVVAALTVAQETYDMVHNDLHTNNVVWSGTADTHLYYHVQGAAGGDRYYRVPTYGRIFKIIDFGRATFKAQKDGPTWFPDVYAPGADADGQYNCAPYFEHGKPKVVPNPSFDLCRLAIAMLESLWPDQPAVKEPAMPMTKEAGRVQNETVSPLWNLLWLWLTDKEGKNFLRLPNGRERYPQFDLYCAIARNSGNAVPAQQLTAPLFDEAFAFRQKDVPADATIWKLNVMTRPQTTAKKLAKKSKNRLRP